MDQNHIPFAPEAATDEPASPVYPSPERAREPDPSPGEPDPAPGEPDPPPPAVEPDAGAGVGPPFASPEAEKLYWHAYMDGARAAGREPGHPHMPADFDLDLARDGREPGLTSAKLLDAWPEAVPVPGGGAVATGYGGSLVPDTAAAPSSRAPRADGWTDDKIARFLAALAQTGVVADACRACGMSRDAAYTLRRRASGRAFSLGWEAAQLIARGTLADDVMSRARHGVIDRVYRDGALVAERHRYDNRLTMAVLTRLDRLAEGLGENAPVVRAVAQEFDQFLGLLPRGNDAAREFIAARVPDPPRDGPRNCPAGGRRAASPHAPPVAAASESALLARLASYERHGAGLACEIAVEDLDPAEMERWTDEQWQRAELSGFLSALSRAEWPEAARNPSRNGQGGETEAGEEADATNGMCKLRKLYLRYHPETPAPAPKEVEDDFAGCSVWEEDHGWMTDFPPTDGFDGYETGIPGEEDYSRALSDEELERLGLDEDSEEAERAERVAEQIAARERFFADDDPDSADGPEPAP